MKIKIGLIYAFTVAAPGRHIRIPVGEWNIQKVKLYQYEYSAFDKLRLTSSCHVEFVET